MDNWPRYVARSQLLSQLLFTQTKREVLRPEQCSMDSRNDIVIKISRDGQLMESLVHENFQQQKSE